MTKKLRHAAIIEVDGKQLLEMLDFEGGTIHSATMPGDTWQPGTVRLMIEHPDLPPTFTGCELVKITPVYHYGMRGYGRIDPPKKQRRKLQK